MIYGKWSPICLPTADINDWKAHIEHNAKAKEHNSKLHEPDGNNSDHDNNDKLNQRIPLSWIVYGNTGLSHDVSHYLATSRSIEILDRKLSLSHDEKMRDRNINYGKKNTTLPDPDSPMPDLEKTIEIELEKATKVKSQSPTLSDTVPNEEQQKQMQQEQEEQQLHEWGAAYDASGRKVEIPKEIVSNLNDDKKHIYLCQIMAYNLYTKYCAVDSAYEINLSSMDRVKLRRKLGNVVQWVEYGLSQNNNDIIYQLYGIFDACIDEMFSLLRTNARAFSYTPEYERLQAAVIIKKSTGSFY